MAAAAAPILPHSPAPGKPSASPSCLATATSSGSSAAPAVAPTGCCEPAGGHKGRPTRTYRLLGQSVVLAEGDGALSNTGWKTWPGAWLTVQFCEQRPPGERKRILDLSCGTGLAGITLALAGHDVVLCDLEVCLATVNANVARNLGASGSTDRQARCVLHSSGGEARVVQYSWGCPLPEEMRAGFDLVLCGDLLYHVWSGRLLTEFLTTLQYINAARQRSGRRLELVFGFQVRSGRQESQVLDAVARRLHLSQEEVPVDTSREAGVQLFAEVKYRIVRLYEAEAPGDTSPDMAAACEQPERDADAAAE